MARPNAAVVMAVTGMPEQVQTSGYLTALGSLLPVKPAGAPGCFALSRMARCRIRRAMPDSNRGG